MALPDIWHDSALLGSSHPHSLDGWIQITYPGLEKRWMNWTCLKGAEAAESKVNEQLLQQNDLQKYQYLVGGWVSFRFSLTFFLLTWALVC